MVKENSIIHNEDYTSCVRELGRDNYSGLKLENLLARHSLIAA